MLLALRFFSINDIFLVPICLLLLYAIIRNRAENPKNGLLKKFYYRGFYYKVFFVFSYTLLTEFVFKGGDTGLYYQAIMDLRAALHADSDMMGTIIKSKHITLPAIIFFDSYLCINLCFGFFALAGSIRIFKFFYYYYPSYKNEIALAAIFIPSVTFWSSGLLKDPICFGAIGFILYGMLNIFVKKVKFASSILLIILCGLLIYNIKVYILLTLIMAITIWRFAEVNKLIKDSNLRTIFSLLTLVISVTIAIFLLNYFTSQEAAQSYKLDTLLEKSEKQRSALESVKVEGNSGFKINSSNPVMLVLESVSATFFRPFLWEVNTPIAFFSALESLIFLLLTLNFFLKKGVSLYFKNIFSDPKLLMCFVFSFVFGIAVGASTTNFGALSRYKIPCMPFYFIMLLLVYKRASLSYPKWFNSVLKLVG